MIGLDTNILVRYLVQDDPVQSPVATAFLEDKLSTENPGFVPLVVLCEISWVLTEGYGYPRPAIAAVVENLLSTRQLRVEHPGIVVLALDDFRSHGLDLADALIGRTALSVGCDETVTFDRRAAKAPSFRLLAS